MGSVSGDPIDSARLSKISIYSSSKLSSNPLDWSQTTVNLSLDNGTILVEGEMDSDQRFFQALEQP